MAGKNKNLLDKLGRIEEETTRLEPAADKIAQDTEYFKEVERQKKVKEKYTTVVGPTGVRTEIPQGVYGPSGIQDNSAQEAYVRTLPPEVQKVLKKTKESNYWFTAGEQERIAAFTAVEQTFGRDSSVPWTEAFARHPDIALAASVALNDGKVSKQQMRSIVAATEILDTTIKMALANSNDTRQYLLNQLPVTKQAGVFVFAEALNGIIQEQQIDAQAIADQPLEWYETFMKNAGGTLSSLLDAAIWLSETSMQGLRAGYETIREDITTGRLSLRPNVAGFLQNWDDVSRGQMDENSYKLLQEEYGAKFVDVIRDAVQAQYSPEEDSFGDLVKKYQNDQEALAIIDKVIFTSDTFEGEELAQWELVHELLGRTDALHKGDLGNMVANELLPREKWGNSLEYSLLDKGTNLAAVIFADPLIVAGKGVKAYQAFRWGLARAAGTNKLSALVQKPAVQRLFKDLADDLKKLNGAAGIEQRTVIRNTIRRKYGKYGVDANFIDSINPFLGVPGRKFTPDDIVDWMTQSDGMMQLMSGNAARRTPLMPHMSAARKAWIDKFVLPAGKTIDLSKDTKPLLDGMFGFVDDTDLSRMSPMQQQEFFEQANREVVENMIRVFDSPTAKGALADEFGVVADSVRPATVGGAKPLTAEQALELGTTAQFGPGTFVGKYRQLGWTKQSMKSWRRRTDRFLRTFDRAPMGASIAIDTAEDVETVRRWARTTFDKYFADAIAEVWLVANPGQRRKLLNGVFETIFEAQGLRRGLSSEIDKFIDDFMVTGSRADEIYAAPIETKVLGPNGEELIQRIEPDNFNGTRSALHMYQTTNRVAVPNFAEVQRLSVKVGLAERLIGVSWSKAVSSGVSYWNTLNLAGPRHVQRSALEDWMGYVASGGSLSDALVGRRIAKSVRATRGGALSVVDDMAIVDNGIGRWLLGALSKEDVAAARLAMEAGDVTTTMTYVNKALARQKTLRGLSVVFGGQDDLADAAYLEAAEDLPILKGKPGRASYDFVQSWIDEFIATGTPVDEFGRVGSIQDDAAKAVVESRRLSVYEELVKSGKLTEDEIKQLDEAAASYADTGQTVIEYGGTANRTGIFNEYSPDNTLLGAEKTRLTSLGFAPDDEITIYRGVPAEATGINPGDWVTANRQLAQDYAGTGRVVSMKVKAESLITDASSGEGAYLDEMVYRPYGEAPEPVRLINETYFKLFHGLDPDDTVRLYKGTGTDDVAVADGTANLGYNSFTPYMAKQFADKTTGRIAVTEIKIKDLPQSVLHDRGWSDEFAMSIGVDTRVVKTRLLSVEATQRIRKSSFVPRRQSLMPSELSGAKTRDLSIEASSMFSPNRRFEFVDVAMPTKISDSPAFLKLDEATRVGVANAVEELSLRKILKVKGEGDKRSIYIDSFFDKPYDSTVINQIALIQDNLGITLLKPIKGRTFFDIEGPLTKNIEEAVPVVVAPKNQRTLNFKKGTGLSPIQEKAIEALIREPEGLKMMDEVGEGASNAFAPTMSSIVNTEMASRGRLSTLGRRTPRRRVDGYEPISFFESDVNSYMRWHGLLSRVLSPNPSVGDGQAAQIVFRSLFRIGPGQTIEKVRQKTVQQLADFFDSEAGAVWRAKMSALGEDSPATIYEFADKYFLDTARLFVNNNGKINRNLLNALKTTTESGAYYASMQGVSIDTLTALAPSAGLRPKTLIAPKYVDVPEDMSRIQQIETGTWEVMGDMISRWSREPIWLANYTTEFENLQPLYKMYVKQGLEPEVAEKFVANMAMQRANDLTLSYVDNPNVRTMLAWNLRNISRYYRATEDFYRRMLRIVKYNPEVIQKGNILYNSVDHSGFIHEDDMGEKYFIYPATAPLAQASAVAFQLFFNQSYDSATGVPNPFQFSAKINMLTPSADPESWMPTIASPFVAVPAKLLTALGPFQSFEKIIFGPKGVEISKPSGLMEETLRAALPAPAIRLLNAMPQDEREGQYASAVKNAIAISAYNGVFDGLETEAQRNEALERVKVTAMGVLGLRFLLGFALPASPQTVPYENITDDLRKMGVSSLRRGYTDLLNSFKGDADKATAAWFKLNPDLLPYTVGITQTPKQKYPNLAEKSFNWMRENKDVVKKFPRVSVFAIPEGSDFSFDAYNLARSFGMIEGKDFDTMLRDVVTAKDYYAYRLSKDAFDAQMKAATSTAARKTLEQQWNQVKTAMFLNNPELDNRVGTLSAKSSPAEKRDDVDEMVRMVEYIKTKRPELYKKPIKQLESMLNLYNVTIVQIKALEGRSDRAATDTRSGLRANLKGNLLAVAGDNRNAKDFYENVLEPLIGGEE